MRDMKNMAVVARANYSVNDESDSCLDFFLWHAKTHVERKANKRSKSTAGSCF